jgi:Flp pilus assembly protein TadG
MFHGFAADRGGNVATLFALGLVPVIAAAGAALDYAELARQKARLQTAVDAAALAVAAARAESSSQRTDLALRTTRANYVALGGSGAVNVTFSEPQPGFYKVDGAASAPLPFMQLFGMRQATVHASAQSQSEAGGGTVEVAMAVDVSGSMRAPDMGGMTRIDTLKQVANNLVDTLAARVPSSQLKFATIPFTTNVNIGRGNTAYVEGANHALFTGTSWAGCVFERAPPNHFSTGYDGSGSPATGKFRAFIAPPEPDQGSGYACANPSNGTNAGYASIQETNPLYGPYSAETNGPNFHCVRHAIQPLTSSVADVKAKIDSLTAESNWGTIVTPALVWALRALTPNAPFPGAAPFSPNNKKVIIALTDGAQVTDTSNRDPSFSSTCAPRQNSATPYRFAPGDLGLAGRTLETTVRATS